MLTKSGKKEFLKSYIGLSNCNLPSMWPVLQPRFNGVFQLNPQIENSFFPNFVFIHRAKDVFSRTYFAKGI